MLDIVFFLDLVTSYYDLFYKHLYISPLICGNIFQDAGKIK